MSSELSGRQQGEWPMRPESEKVKRIQEEQWGNSIFVMLTVKFFFKSVMDTGRSFASSTFSSFFLSIHVGLIWNYSCPTEFHAAMREAFQSKVQHPRKAMSLFLKAGKGKLLVLRCL